MLRNFQSSTPPMPPNQPMPSGPSMSATPHTAASYISPYLPADAPPWPTTVLQRPPQSTATSLMSTSTGTIAGRKSRSARSILTTLSLLVLTLIVGTGLTYGILYFNGQIRANTAQPLPPIPKVAAQPTSGTTPSTSVTGNTGALPTPTSFSAMSSDNQKALSALIKYPSNWVEDPPSQPASDGTVVARFHPQEQLGIIFFVGKIPTTSGATSTTTLNQDLITEIYRNGGNAGNTNLQAVQTTTPHRTIAGVQWDEQDATFSDTNGLLMHIASISVKHRSSFYVFLILAPDLYYSDVVQKYLPPMLDSFKFLS